MANKKIVFFLGALVIFFLIITSIFFVGNDSVKSEEEIEIGAVFILSGVGASSGISEQQGVDLAVKEINAKGGVNGKKLKIHYHDTPSDDQKAAISAIHQLKNKGIKIIIGTTWSNSALAVAPLVCENKLLMLTPAIGVKEVEEECDYIFNMWMVDEKVSKILGKKIFADGVEKLGIIGSNQAWEIVQAKAVKEAFIAAGGEVVVYEIPTAEQKDFKTEILKVKQKKPDALFIQYISQDIIAKQLKEAGIEIPIYAELIDLTRVKNAHGALEGTIATTQINPTTEFIRKFNKEYNKKPDAYAADNAYDAVMLITKAIENTGSTDPEVLKEYLKSLKYYNGSSGYMTFNENGGITKDIRFVQVKNGEITEYS